VARSLLSSEIIARFSSEQQRLHDDVAHLSAMILAVAVHQHLAGSQHGTAGWRPATSVGKQPRAAYREQVVNRRRRARLIVPTNTSRQAPQRGAGAHVSSSPTSVPDDPPIH